MVSWPAMAASVIVGTTTAAVLFCRRAAHL